MPDGGVFFYAMMAAGGDLGASVVPQLVGIVTDHSNLKIGMAVATLFPLIAVFLYFYMWKTEKSDIMILIISKKESEETGCRKWMRNTKPFLHLGR